MMNIIKNFKPKISNVSDFQLKTVKYIAKKLYVDKKQKFVLADEVGLGKTYVCRGLIELGQKIKNDKFTVLYISPNDGLAKQNHPELCKGFTDSKKAKRLSSITDFSKQDYNIYSFSSSMFFNKQTESNVGDEDERNIICKYLYSIADLYTNPDDFRLYADAVASALYKPDRRYWIYSNNELNQNFLTYCQDEYKEFISNSRQCSNCNNSEKKYADMLFNYMNQTNFNINNVVDCLKTLLINNNKSDIIDLTQGQFNPNTRTTFNNNNNYHNIINAIIPYNYNYNNNLSKTDTADWFYHLRRIINFINLCKLQPDIIIIDEFHKHFTEYEKNEINEYYIKYLNLDTKWLFVSATPYKIDMCGYEEPDDAADESNDSTKGCFNNFSDLYTYVSGNDDNDVETKLNEIKNRLNKLKTVKNKADFDNEWEKCKKAKIELQVLLSECIVRTERYTLNDSNNGYMKIKIPDIKPEYVENDKEQIKKYFKYDAEQIKTLFEYAENTTGIVTYCKMTPYVASFSEDYQLNIDYSNIGENYLWDGKSEPEHFRYQKLKEIVMPKGIDKILWIPPILNQHNLKGVWKEFAETNPDYTKTLVFGRYKMSVNSIAAILSAQLNNITPQNTLSDDIFKIAEDNDKIIVCFKNALKNFRFTECIKKDGEKIEYHEDGALQIIKGFTEVFYNYLKRNKNILANAGVTDKDSLYQYCEDGCLTDVLKEYLFLIIKGKNELTKDDCILFKSIFTENDKIECALKINENENESEDKEKIQIQKNAEIHCNFACVYEEKNNSQEKFNSPFYPFVLTVTASGQEGLNFHNYCHSIFHWQSSPSPIDYEQREGRINRYRGHILRKRLYQHAHNEMYAKANYWNTENWTNLFRSAKVNIKDNMNGLCPDWIICDKKLDESLYIKSYDICNPLSKEETNINKLNDYLKSYRVSLGYGIGYDEICKIKENYRQLTGKNDLNFEEIFINLSPK